MKRKSHIGIVGCGDISSTYLTNLRSFDILQVIACADIHMERAKKRAEQYNIPKTCTVGELMADPEIDIVVNLTVPNAHADVALAAIDAGKAIYSEKPLATKKPDGKAILEAAAAKNVYVGNAPDTFLGGGFQTCIKLINDGQIGMPVAATAFMLNHGMEHWHEDPYFFYQPGAGPMFDFGPYYLTALIAMMGPIRRVTASMQITFPERTVTSKLKYGTKIPVNTPTYIVGAMEFVSGAIGTIITSFDVWHHRLPFIEIYGTEGTLSTPDPNYFDGPVYIRRVEDEIWHEIPLTHSYTDDYRGLGVVDLVCSMRSGRLPRANGEMAYHVLDIMESFLESAATGKHITLTSTCSCPAALMPGFPIWEEDQNY